MPYDGNINKGKEPVVDSDTRRQKHQALMAELVERKVRTRAQQLYDKRGQVEGHALQDWVQAESEVLRNSILAPLYRRLRTEGRESQALDSIRDGEPLEQDSSTCESHI
jgi:hypothetical protein